MFDSFGTRKICHDTSGYRRQGSYRGDWLSRDHNTPYRNPSRMSTRAFNGEMLRLYLDIETYREREEDAFVSERVIAIGVIEDSTPYRPESARVWDEPNVRFKYYTIWSVDRGDDCEREMELVRSFHEYLRKLVSNYRVNVVGFNHLRYDIPLLIQKCVEYGVALIEDLNVLWYKDVLSKDYFQTSLPFHDMRYKGLNLDLLVEWARKAGIAVPDRYGSGGDVARWFKAGQYGDILKHLESDLRIIRIIDLNSRDIYNVIKS